MPTTSNDANPTVVYENVGQYDVTLTISNTLGQNTITMENFVEVLPTPFPAFTYETRRPDGSFHQ